MHPYLNLGTAVLDMYYVMLKIGITAGSLVSVVVLKKQLGWTKAITIVATMIWGALFGAHLAHCIFHWHVYRIEPLRILNFWRDGHSFLGAPAFCAILLVLLSVATPWVPFLATADAFALGTPLGLVFARIGCYLKGCCWGVPIAEGHLFYGISYKLINYRLTAVHPVQLYSAGTDLVIFFCLIFVMRRWKLPGLLTGTFFLLYAVARFILEFFRGDSPRMAYLWNLTIHQCLCIFLLVSSVCFLCTRLHKNAKAPSPR